MLTIAFIAVAVAIVAWSFGTAALLWVARERKRARLASADEVPAQVGDTGGTDADDPPTPVAATSAGFAEPDDVDSVCRGVVVGLGDPELTEAELLLTAIGSHGRVMVATRDPAREARARNVVSELAARAGELGVSPPLVARDGEVEAGPVFLAVDGAADPLLRAIRWERAARLATREAASRSATELPTAE